MRVVPLLGKCSWLLLEDSLKIGRAPGVTIRTAPKSLALGRGVDLASDSFLEYLAREVRVHALNTPTPRITQTQEDNGESE